jgi:hypothetical protein
MRVTKRQIAGVFQEIWAHSTYKRRGGGLIEAFGTFFLAERSKKWSRLKCRVVWLYCLDLNNTSFGKIVARKEQQEKVSQDL